MSELVAGAAVAHAEALGETFRELMHTRGEGLDDDGEDHLGDATAFTGVAQLPGPYQVRAARLGRAAGRAGPGRRCPATRRRA